MNNKLLKELSRNLTTDRDNYMNAFRENVFMYLGEKGITINEIAKEADLSESTINSFLYGNSQDIMLSTAIKLATALHVSVDELSGADTISTTMKETISICRNLPEHSLYLVQYFIKHQEKICGKKENKNHILSVLKPTCRNGELLTTNIIEPIEIKNLQELTNGKICIGVQIPCEHYMPYYSPNEILLVSADRKAENNEKCVITKNGKIYIVIKEIYKENKITKTRYVFLMNNHFSFSENEIDDIVGYVFGFLKPDLTLGIR